MASAIAFFWSSVCLVAEANLKKDIENVLAEEGLAGIAWTLVGENGEVSVGSAGLQDNSSGSAFAPDTRFHVGSLTKARCPQSRHRRTN
jgi:CubicO group peptidase (beta-lactamase class C family)